MADQSNQTRLFLIDGHSLIYRAFFAIRSLSTSKGFPTNAVYGFTNMLMKLLREKKPDYLAVAFDTKGPTQRHEEYEDYKAQRPEMPDALQLQIPVIHRVVSAFRIPILMVEGYEADDLIGTVSKKAEQEGLHVTIVTGDKDLFQLIGKNVQIYDTMKEKTFDARDVMERFGVEPAQIVEIMGLMGDSIDNIPGVPGIGEKTAAKLIQNFETIENLLKNLQKVNQPKLRDKLREHSDLARLSRRLATLQLDCPVEPDLQKFKVQSPNLPKLMGLFQEFEFTGLLKRVSEIQEGRSPESNQASGSLSRDKRESIRTEVISDSATLTDWIQQIKENQEVVIQPWPAGKWVGLSLCIENKAVYIPIGNLSQSASPRLTDALATKRLAPLLKNPSIKKTGHDLKSLTRDCFRRGLRIRGLAFDTSIASYLLNPTRRDHSLETLSLEHLGVPLPPLPKTDLAEQSPVETIAAALGDRGRAVLEVSKKLRSLLAEKQLSSLFEEIEMPLIPVLGQMENTGINLDVEILAEFSKELEKQLVSIVQKIYKIAGEEFNVNSPKQLSKVLFERLGLKPLKRTKTGFSTNEEVLQQLGLEHELPSEVLKYRHMAKLKSTYVDALPVLVDPATKRLHTSFNQTVTATGRLSSSDPNLQNIPIKGEWGTRLRQAFTADKGSQLMSFDYNQIELRILAHLSQDEKLIKDFKNGNDVHASTAMEIFGQPAEEITPDMRRTGKTVNFGIVYGISPYGLSTTLGVTQIEAKQYIDSYFSRYQGVHRFIDQTIQEASERGYVTTMLSRVRPIPELASGDRATRGFGERTAVNTVIQGSAADLIKLAMIRISTRLPGQAPKSRMLLQIHDELLFEGPKKECDAVKVLVTEEMERVMELSVPLKVDVGMGKNWNEAHP